MSDTSGQEHPKRNLIWQTTKSVLAALLGVQSQKNWEADAQSPSPLRFIVGGLILGFVFFATVFAITWVIASYIV
jgi:hypothetical protein